MRVSAAGGAPGRTILWSRCWLHCSPSCSHGRDAEHVTCPLGWPRYRSLASRSRVQVRALATVGEGWTGLETQVWLGGPSLCRTHQTQWPFSPPPPGTAETPGLPYPGAGRASTAGKGVGVDGVTMSDLLFPGAWLSSLNISCPFLQSDEVLTVIKAKAQWPAWQPLNV